MSIEEIIKRSGQLPVGRIAPSVNEALATSQAVVITAAPGAGKSTLLPLTILKGMNGSGKLLMLEPRRLAARQIAERMASILGEAVGQTVGYRVRFESKVSAATRIEVLTEGILTRMLVDDATLEGVDAVIFDEFHERSIHSDLALAFTRKAQHIIRPDLKIVIMSATIDATRICHELQAPLIESEGRMYPVQTVHATEDCNRSDLPQAVATAIREAHREHEGDILAFLPGQYEIQKCEELLAHSLEPSHIYPLYGNLPPEQQRKTIAPSAEGERKIVLATPIAETSLTIEGVKIVIDSGFCRTPVFDAHTGLTHLETTRISTDMAAQRTGRAGRVTEGFCYRLWTLASEHRMETRRKPEITEADLAPMLLDIAAFGEGGVEELPWLTPPPAAHVGQARQLLQQLGALAEDGTITARGKRMAALPCHPRIARMILGAQTPALKSLACDLAALLEEKDPMADIDEADITLRIATLRANRRKGAPGRWTRIARIAAEYRRMAQAAEDNTDVVPTHIGALVAYAYPERIATAIDHIGNYRLSNGSNIRLAPSDSLAAHAWIAIASLHANGNAAGRVFLAAPVCPDDLEAQTRQNLSWNSKQGCVMMQQERRIGKLVIESKPLARADKTQVIGIVCEAAPKDGLSMFDWNEDVQRLQRRVAKVAEWHPELQVPNLSTEHLLATAAEWLPFYLETDGHVKSTIAELKKINLCEVLWALIPYPVQQEIDRLAPTHITVPTGSRIRVDYRAGADAPTLSVRLQECFGLKETPCVDNGRRPVLMELLSPGFKPVQLTQDLHSFWQGTYFEVRKELRRRYPKHYWPENPLEAEAVRGVKKTKAS